MGQLIYAGATEYAIDDRLLAHVKVAVAAKLRRQESFLLSWDIDLQHGSGRVSLWMSPAIPLEFKFSGSRVPELSQVWLEALMETANSSRGMVLLTEADATRLLQESRARSAAISAGH
ncbi:MULTISPECIES: hypothetical protein [unclassified Agrococcus]|uniref:DUF7882 family protein n=1 Tax=unclassified Agrococcus TaxID=2615065 RepID=UPI003612FF9B